MRANLTIGCVLGTLVGGCSLSPYFEQAPQCEEGESRERVLACGPCLTGTATDTCNERRQWVEVQCDDPTSDADGDLFPNVECVPGEPVDCNDHNDLVFPGATGLEVCFVGETQPCTTSCGTASVQPCTEACTWGACIECVPGSSTECTTTCGSTGRTMCTENCVPAADCTPPEEICNEVDDDCDTVINGGDAGCVPGDPTPCTTSCGTAGIGDCTDACTPALAADCPPPVEACNGRDDDCDTLSDEEWDCWVGQSQLDEAPDPDLVRYCLMDCTWSPWQESTELCNGLDDDGDTIADEGFPCQMGSGVRCTDAGCTPLTCTTDCGSVGSGTCSDTCNPPSGGACVPPPEVCDGSDNDCNDGVDEDWRDVLGDACDGDDTDLCVEGSWLCNAAGDGVTCTDTTSSTDEVCNSADDDCDTSVDEGLLNACGTCGPTPTEICDGIDNNCNGTIDDAWRATLGTTCDGTDSDLCAEGVLICNAAGTGTTCNDTTGNSVEVCDSVDNDCNDTVDDAWRTVLGTRCDGTDSDLCPEGNVVCNAAGTGTTCNDDPAEGDYEVCNAFDDDCDTVVDEASHSGTYLPAICAGCYLTSRGRSWYLLCTTYSRTWLNARAECEGWGYHLVTVNDAGENDQVQLAGQSLLGCSVFCSNRLWIGYNDMDREGSWTWTDGLSGYTHWAGGEPNPTGAATLDCAQLNPAGSGYWSSADCTSTNFSVCEVEI